MNGRVHGGMAALLLSTAAIGACSQEKAKEQERAADKGSGAGETAAPAPAKTVEATALPTGTMSPVDLAADDKYLFWTNSSMKAGTVVRSSHDGKTLGLLAKDEPVPAQIALDSTHAWWRVNGGFVRSAKEGGGTEVVLMTDDDVGDIAAVAGKLYYTIPSKGMVMAVEPGKLAETLATGQNHPHAIAADADHVYFANLGSGGKDGAIMRVARAGGAAPTVLAANQWGPDEILIDPGRVFWSMPKRAGNAVMTAKLDGTEPLELAKDIGDVSSLAVDLRHLYIATDRAVKRVPRAGGAVEDVVSDVKGNIAQLVLSASHLFWNDYKKGKIMSAPKPPQ